MLDWLYEALGTMLYWFSSLFGGKYVFGLLLYALLFKVLFLPFSIKQQKNQIKMAELAPKIELIKAKYKGRTDQPTMQKQQQEILELQQKEGYSPFSGCLPLLLQLPIITLLYTVIRKPLSYIAGMSDEAIKAAAQAAGLNADNALSNQIELAALIKEKGIPVGEIDLDRIPDLTLFNTNLGNTPSLSNFSWLVLVPVLAAALTWLSMFLSRKWNANPAMQADNAQANSSMKMMDIMMPAMTLFMAFGFSAMMGVYWIYQSALGIIQSFVISKAMPLPKYTEDQLKEMKKAQKEAEKAARSAAKNAPKVRSLHYIDDEDYEVLPEIETNGKDGKKKSGDMDLPEI